MVSCEFHTGLAAGSRWMKMTAVIPANAGVHAHRAEFMDSGFRRNDGRERAQSAFSFGTRRRSNPVPSSHGRPDCPDAGAATPLMRKNRTRRLLRLNIPAISHT
jgi:hypothetical protein